MLILPEKCNPHGKSLKYVRIQEDLDTFFTTDSCFCNSTGILVPLCIATTLGEVLFDGVKL